MTVLIGQGNYDAEIYYKHTKVVKVRKHQGDVGCATSSMTQIVANSAKFTTALNATKHTAAAICCKKILM